MKKYRIEQVAELSFLMEKQRVQLSVSFVEKKNGSIKAQLPLTLGKLTLCNLRLPCALGVALRLICMLCCRFFSSFFCAWAVFRSFYLKIISLNIKQL